METPKPKVLIVEDDMILSYEWMGGLRARGYDVSHYANIEAGIQHCVRDWPDLIVLDAFFMLPSGKFSRQGAASFCADISRLAIETARSMPIVIGVSGAKVSQYMPHHVFDAIPSHWMTCRVEKPFTVRSLVAQVDELLNDKAMDDLSVHPA